MTKEKIIHEPNFSSKKDGESFIIELTGYVPCNEHEKNIYGVDYKKSDQSLRAYILRHKVEDTKNFIYQVDSGGMGAFSAAYSIPKFFDCENKAEKFCKKKLKEDWDKIYNKND